MIEGSWGEETMGAPIEFGRKILSEEEMPTGVYDRPGMARRRQVLRATISALEAPGAATQFRACAVQNLARWRAAPSVSVIPSTVRVISGDWGAVTLGLTKQYGTTFAVLNMANAYVPGGGYVEGMPAQEENMFRRTDCHFSIDPGHVNRESERYHPAFSALLNAEQGRVFLDVDRPRICLRGPEDRGRRDLGYLWLAEDEIFPFYELRASAMDLRSGKPFDPVEARVRIVAQLETLIAANIRHAVLSAFGCGAFQNPASAVAQIYREEIMRRQEHYDLLAFAIFHPGYGPDNLSVFRRVFEA
jgi:hypothetical protein